MVGMMLECSPGELLARDAFMHHDDHGHDASMHYAVLKGLTLLAQQSASMYFPIRRYVSKSLVILY